MRLGRRLGPDGPPILAIDDTLERPPRREIECLDAGEVAALLDWLRDNKPGLWPMGCLMGLAGLRLTR